MESPIYDVLVAGMGPVGAAAAVFAGRAGLRVCAVDRSEDVFPLPRATHFDAEIMRLFQRADLSRAIGELVTTYNGGLHLGADGEPIRDFRVEAARGPLGWYPHYTFLQPALDRELRRAASVTAGVDCRAGVDVAEVSEDGESVSALLRDQHGNEKRVSARYLIACDGASSPIRKSLGIPLRDYGFEEPWIIVDAKVADPSVLPDYSVMFCDPNRPATYIPQPGCNRRWEFMLLDGEDPDEMSTLEVVHELLAPHVDVAGLEIVRKAVYRFHGLITTKWRAGRVFLAGDAAHQTPPFYGQGMCHGIRDVANLVWKLALVVQGTADARLLDTYERERQPHVKTIIDASVENGRYICILDPEKARERDAQLRARAAAGQDVRSFRSVIPGLIDGVLSSHPHGERGQLMIQPDVLLEGRQMLLDDALGSGFALVLTAYPIETSELRWFREELKGSVVLVGHGAEHLGASDSAIRDHTGALAEWFRENAAHAVLIRPDHYIFGVADQNALVTNLLRDLRVQLEIS